ncbi:MAG TPA: hypothetical protein PK597_04570 [Oscillospiraceae bacterium]|nr:hypothetical protein [Oscillospiraceae bacterium]
MPWKREKRCGDKDPGRPAFTWGVSDRYRTFQKEGWEISKHIGISEFLRWRSSLIGKRLMTRVLKPKAAQKR